MAPASPFGITSTTASQAKPAFGGFGAGSTTATGFGAATGTTTGNKKKTECKK